QQRIDGIGGDAIEFARKVNSYAKAVAGDMVDRTAQEAAIELLNRLKRSRDALSQQQALTKQAAQEHRRFDQAQARTKEIGAKLNSMCQEAGCKDYSELPEAERRSERRRRIEADLGNLDDRLRGLSSGATVDEFVDEAMAVDPDGIANEMARLEQAIQSLNQEKSLLDRTIGKEQNELSKMDGSAKAAELEEEIQILLAGLESNVEQYARLRIAASLLSRAIEIYRDRNQGPVLSRASTLFKQITRGSFDGIRTEFGEGDRPFLVGLRQANGEIVAVEGMSDGTADQLYLSLRLAALEHYLATNEAVPFILDDIMIRFDDDRAAAALATLAQLSLRTQVILFTHHSRLVELAEKHVDSSVLITHSLGGMA
ncbi:ATP-binding protein, partial [Thermodesulfobacteriota bacterium]